MLDSSGIQPGDVLVAAKLAVSDSSASVRQLEQELGMSKSSVANAIRRLRELDLVKDDAGGVRRVNRLALRDFFEHAVRWIAPAKVGDFELGLPTAHASEAMADKLSGDDDPVVMPLPHGPVRGRAVTPIHPRAPQAAAKDPKLRSLLAIVDAFRIGGARQREVARVALLACL
jgi:DNA-binding MarR family transcriptional regulator